jgi:hypothetical protein
LTWIKLDDKAPRHPKIAGLSDRAFRWWVRGLCYASEFLTDGLLPFEFTRDIPQKSINELRDRRLWVLGDLGWQIHDYMDHQTARADVEREREKTRDRQAKWKAERRKSNAVTEPSQTVTSNAPVTGHREQIQRTDTDTDTEKTPTVSSPRVRPLVASPLDYDRMHGKHMTGFCGFVCLPMFLFDGWVNRVLASGISEEAARARVNTFCADVMARWKSSGQVPGGDELSFWRAEWSNAHPAPALVRPAAVAHRSSTAALRAALAAKGEQP